MALRMLLLQARSACCKGTRSVARVGTATGVQLPCTASRTAVQLSSGARPWTARCIATSAARGGLAEQIEKELDYERENYEPTPVSTASSQLAVTLSALAPKHSSLQPGGDILSQLTLARAAGSARCAKRLAACGRGWLLPPDAHQEVQGRADQRGNNVRRAGAPWPCCSCVLQCRAWSLPLWAVQPEDPAYEDEAGNPVEPEDEDMQMGGPLMPAAICCMGLGAHADLVLQGVQGWSSACTSPRVTRHSCESAGPCQRHLPKPQQDARADRAAVQV